jgi:hypothetical protein
MTAASVLSVNAHAPSGEGRGNESHHGDNGYGNDNFLRRQYKGNLTLMNMVIIFGVFRQQECATDITIREKNNVQTNFFHSEHILWPLRHEHQE